MAIKTYKNVEVVIRPNDLNNHKLPTQEEVTKICEEHKDAIREWHAIQHYEEFNPITKKNESRHIHIMLNFYEAQQAVYIAKWFNVEEHNLERLKEKRYKYATNYLVHYKKYWDKEKTIPKKAYDVSEVYGNKPYKIHDKEVEDHEDKSEMLQMLYDYGDCKITRKQLMEQISPEEYNRYANVFKRMQEYRNEKVGNRNMEVIYITGDSGSGKTTLAKFMANLSHYDYFVSGSGKDFLDGYDKEECIILDDFRGNLLTKAEFFKLADNHTNSSVRSRYKNKDISRCRLLIITSVKRPEEIYNWNDSDDYMPIGKIIKEEKEPFKQLARRLGNYYIRIDRSGKLKVVQWDCEESPQPNKTHEVDSPITMKGVYKAMNINPMTHQKQTILDKLAFNMSDQQLKFM